MIATGRALALAIADAYEERPDTWCQGSYARGRSGEWSDVSDPGAARFCLAGAVNRAFITKHTTEGARDWLFSRISTVWNDATDRTVAEVIAKLREIGGAG